MFQMSGNQYVLMFLKQLETTNRNTKMTSSICWGIIQKIGKMIKSRETVLEIMSTQVWQTAAERKDGQKLE